MYFSPAFGFYYSGGRIFTRHGLLYSHVFAVLFLAHRYPTKDHIPQLVCQLSVVMWLFSRHVDMSRNNLSNIWIIFLKICTGHTLPSFFIWMPLAMIGEVLVFTGIGLSCFVSLDSWNLVAQGRPIHTDWLH